MEQEKCSLHSNVNAYIYCIDHDTFCCGNQCYLAHRKHNTSTIREYKECKAKDQAYEHIAPAKIKKQMTNLKMQLGELKIILTGKKISSNYLKKLDSQFIRLNQAISLLCNSIKSMKAKSKSKEETDVSIQFNTETDHFIPEVSQFRLMVHSSVASNNLGKVDMH